MSSTVSSDLLPVYFDNSEVRIALLLPDVLGPDVELRAILDFCRLYRIRGIAAFFLGDPPAALLTDLSKSGRAFLHFLRAAPDAARATGRSAPFFDALAATDREGARAIALASRPTTNPELEYEEEFLYVWFLIRHFVQGATGEECSGLLDRWRTALDGAADARLDVCTAFLENDAVAFHAAVTAVLEHDDAANRERVAKGGLPPEAAVTEALLNVEGLALLRLAEAKGFPTATEYVGVPSSARASPPLRFDPDAWRTEAS